MGKKIKKLTLSRETVRRLTEEELRALGGASGTTCVNCCAWKETSDCETWGNTCLPASHPSICH